MKQYPLMIDNEDRILLMDAVTNGINCADDDDLSPKQVRRLEMLYRLLEEMGSDIDHEADAAEDDEDFDDEE